MFALVAASLTMLTSPTASAARSSGTVVTHPAAVPAAPRTARNPTTTTATMTLAGPAKAKVGDDVLLAVDASALSGAAGFEVSLRYAKGAFRLGGDEILAKRLSLAGGTLVPGPPWSGPTASRSPLGRARPPRATRQSVRHRARGPG